MEDMMSEERFPEDIAYGSSGGPVFSTSIVGNAGGFEKRNSHWAEARSVYNVAHGVKNAEQLSRLIAFFRARKGRAQAFRFKDWSDYQGVGELIALGDGQQTIFPLIKRYISGAEDTPRRITKPIAQTVAIYLDGTLLSGGYQLDATTGMVTFDSAPVQDTEIRADFEFDVPVRFETDQLAARLDDYGVYSWGDIPLVEVRVAL